MTCWTAIDLHEPLSACLHRQQRCKFLRVAWVAAQALEVPQAVGVKQGIMQGITVGTTNLTFLCSYALAFWYGSTRVHAGAYVGAPPPRFGSISELIKAYPRVAETHRIGCTGIDAWRG